MNSHVPILAITVMALCMSVYSLNPQSPRTEDDAPTHLVAPSAKILGLTVKNAAEKNLGDVGDLLIDPHSGAIRYAVLDVGGFLGIGADHRIVPWSFIHVDLAGKDSDKLEARTSLTEAQVEAAPLCKKDDVFTAELDRRIEAVFGVDDAWRHTGKEKPTFVRLSDVKGVRIDDPSGKEVGTVKDVVLAPQNDCVAYGVVDMTKEAGGKTVAVPFSRLKLAYDHENELVATTPVELARLQGAPEYDHKDWKRMSSPSWIGEMSKYYDCDPFWKTSRFATARRVSVQTR